MKIILHLCADIGSDSKPYQDDPNFEVVKVGEDIGVENFSYSGDVHGVIANPVCTEFSFAKWANNKGNGDHEQGVFLVNHCIRIIKECNPDWWVLENPATGRLKQFIGDPVFSYQPWQFGSPWTKRTSLWGDFKHPEKIYTKWEDVPKNKDLYIRPNREKPSLAFLHKSAIQFTPEFDWAKPFIKNDADFRSLCSQGFAKAFKAAQEGEDLNKSNFDDMPLMEYMTHK